jgi:transposase
MANYTWLPGWQTGEPIVEDTQVTIPAEYTILPDHCPHCGVVGRLYSHGPRDIGYRDIPVFAKHTIIRVNVKRFRCRECNRTSTQPLPHMHPARQLTNRAVAHLREQCLRRNYAVMSRETGIDESVIRFVCNEQYREIDGAVRPDAPVILGIDELTLDGSLRFIAFDLGAKRTMDIRRDCATNTVESWLFLMRHKERIQIVTQDMRDQYRQIVWRILPGAIIVVDKWHIQKKANEALNHVRARHKKIETEKERKRVAYELARTGKKPKSRKEKDPWMLRRCLQQSRKKHKPRTLLLLDGVFKNNPLLSDAWHTKEGFYDIWDAGTRKEAERLFAEWRKNIPESVKEEFEKVAATVDDWKTEIFAYFDYPYTNALTEGINGIVKIVNRGGRGYTFENIRAKALKMVPIGDTRKAKREAKQAAREAATGLFTCESCLGAFDMALAQLHRPVIAKAFIGRAKQMRICPTCHVRFHHQAKTIGHGDSHLKNA